MERTENGDIGSASHDVEMMVLLNFLLQEYVYVSHVR